jgi:hypothetical protein
VDYRRIALRMFINERGLNYGEVEGEICDRCEGEEEKKREKK